MQWMNGRLLCGVALLAAVWAGLTAGARAQDAAKGQVLLAAARQALGGERPLAGVETLQVTGTFRRVIGTDDTDGDFELFLERPDKYLRSEKTGTPGQPSTETIEALVGTEIRDEVRGGGGRVGGGGVIGGGVIGGGVIGGGDAPPDGAPPAETVAEPDDRDAGQPEVGAAGRVGRGGFGLDPDAQRRARQADVARLLLMWLLATDAPMPWVGIAESPDGKAEVLEARFADGQPTRLFLDAVSYMPLMLQWQGLPARAGGPGGRRGFGGGRGRGQAADAGTAGTGGLRPGGAAEPITFDMTFSDHRVINGIRLPHTITRGTNGQTIERWTIRSYRVNPSFDAETFTR